MPRLKFQLLHPFLMWLIVIIGLLIVWQVVPEGFVFDSGRWGTVVVILGFVDWLYLYSMSLKVHRKAFTNVHNINELVTEGTYAVVRHPLFLADIILGLCLFVAVPSYKISAAVIWLALVLVFWANLEERLLEEKFLADYQSYKKRVPMLIPKFWN